MCADVFNTSKAQTAVGANPYHRIFLALGRQKCDSLLSTEFSHGRLPSWGMEARPLGRAFFVPAIVTGSVYTSNIARTAFLPVPSWTRRDGFSTPHSDRQPANRHVSGCFVDNPGLRVQKRVS
ncbi:hypothetical protein AEB_P1671 [Altererythrobacter sp. B11]|nr:hypothetical protein AEB_P1671 [Altererythrobacter sp. B11]